MVFKKEAQTYQPFDIGVIGGGPAGIAAAISAARRGYKTVLIEGNGCLGGTCTAGALPFWLGAVNGSIPFRKMLEAGLAYRDLPRPKTAVAGIFQEACLQIRREGGGVGPGTVAQTDRYPGLDRLGCHDEFTFDLETGKRVLEEMAVGAGVHLMYYTFFLDAEMENGRINGIYAANKSGILYIPVKAAVDCSGDADLAARAGFETYKGERKTGEMCSASLVAHIENIDAGPVEEYLNNGGDPWFYEICAAAKARYPQKELPDYLIIFPMLQNGVFMINGGTSFFGFDGTDGEDMTRLALKGRQRARDLVDCIFKPFFPGGKNSRLRLTAAYPGIRETRRIVGEYVLTEKDLIEGKSFDDTVALAGRHFDLARKEGQPFHQKELSVKAGMTEIPYRILVPRGSENIIAAGRCVSAEGQALGPARIISTCFAMGEAAGVAAGLSLRTGKTLPRIDIELLKEDLIKKGAVISY